MPICFQLAAWRPRYISRSTLADLGLFHLIVFKLKESIISIGEGRPHYCCNIIPRYISSSYIPNYPQVESHFTTEWIFSGYDLVGLRPPSGHLRAVAQRVNVVLTLQGAPYPVTGRKERPPPPPSLVCLTLIGDRSCYLSAECRYTNRRSLSTSCL